MVQKRACALVYFSMGSGTDTYSRQLGPYLSIAFILKQTYSSLFTHHPQLLFQDQPLLKYWPYFEPLM